MFQMRRTMTPLFMQHCFLMHWDWLSSCGIKLTHHWVWMMGVLDNSKGVKILLFNTLVSLMGVV
jgi:hypothetical protein